MDEEEDEDENFFAHLICCISFPQVFSLTDEVEKMKYYISNCSVFKDEQASNENFFCQINLLKKEERYWNGGHDKLVNDYFKKSCGICDDQKGRLKIVCKYNTHKCTFREKKGSAQEYVPRIGFKVGYEAHSHCNDYVHAFCAMNKGLGQEEDDWTYQFAIEKDKISEENTVVPVHEVKDKTDEKLNLQSQIHFVCPGHAFGEKKQCYDCLEDHIIVLGPTQHSQLTNQAKDLVGCDFCQNWYHPYCIARESLREQGKL